MGDKKKNIGYSIHPKTSPEDGFAMLPHLPLEEFKELMDVINKIFRASNVSVITSLVNNLSKIHEVREANTGMPVEMERDKLSYKEDVNHTMHRPDTRVPVPVRKNENGVLEIGTVLELRDTKAPINKIS